MSDYKMVPKVATEDMLDAMLRLSPECWGEGAPFIRADALDAYQAMLAAAPPFVVTDEVAGKVLDRYVAETLLLHDDAPTESRVAAMRAAIEKVLGGGV